MNYVQYDGNFPIMDVLVAVHYDNLDPKYFVRLQVESRIDEYIGHGRKVYNLSALNNPNNGPNISNIVNPLENPEESKDFGLELQMEELLKKLKMDGRELSVEIIGITFLICVPRVHDRLIKESLIKPIMNYDCTDSVEIYESIGRQVINRRVLRLGDDDMLVPIPSPDVLERYKQHLKEFPES